MLYPSNKKLHSGVEANRRWPVGQLKDGHGFRKPHVKGCVFNNWAVFYDGKFVTVNQLDGAAIERIIKK